MANNPQESGNAEPLVHIDIRGTSNSGKTTIAYLIEKTLVGNGFTQVTVENREGDLATRSSGDLEALVSGIRDNRVDILDNNKPLSRPDGVGVGLVERVLRESVEQYIPDVENREAFIGIMIKTLTERRDYYKSLVKEPVS